MNIVKMAKLQAHNASQWACRSTIFTKSSSFFRNIWHFSQIGFKKALNVIKLYLYNCADTLYTLILYVGLFTVEWENNVAH